MDILNLFHHIHHTKNSHAVHHCGGEHVRVNPKLNYNIEHCSCGKHRINKKSAIGHDFDMNKVEILFKEPCPKGGWHVESGLLRNKF